MFTHSDFKMELSFAILSSIAARTFKKTGILSLNVKKIPILSLEKNQTITVGSLCF